MWIDVFTWDKNKNNTYIKIYHKLTNDHIFPNSAHTKNTNLPMNALMWICLTHGSIHHRTETSAGHEYHGHATEFLKRTIFSVSPPQFETN